MPVCPTNFSLLALIVLLFYNQFISRVNGSFLERLRKKCTCTCNASKNLNLHRKSLFSPKAPRLRDSRPPLSLIFRFFALPPPHPFFFLLPLLYIGKKKHISSHCFDTHILVYGILGPAHQARLPECNSESYEDDNKLRENLRWVPSSISDQDLIMYLRAARSMAFFVGMCDPDSGDDGSLAASKDCTTANAVDIVNILLFIIG